MQTPAERQRLQRKLEEILEAQTRLRREKQAVSREIDRKVSRRAPLGSIRCRRADGDEGDGDLGSAFWPQTMMEQVRLMVIRQELEKTAKEFDEWLNAAAEKEKSLPGRMQGPAAQVRRPAGCVERAVGVRGRALSHAPPHLPARRTSALPRRP